ncbi:MAG: FAD-dependent oxidoreductase [Acholeplasma sp.]|nr:FAD-dependent oxidoreductase [Acholeplasma sp.]
MFNFSIERSDTSVDDKVLYDFIALGAGPAGLNAALYASRKGLKTAIIGHEIGGQLKNTADVDNYLGFGFIEAEALIDKFVSHVKTQNIPMITGLWVESITKHDVFSIKLSNGQQFNSKTLLYAFGGSPRKLNVLGEKEFSSKGVSYCVTCDAPFFKGKEVVVAGGGNSAVDAAIDLARTSSKVTIIHRSQFRADQSSIDKLLRFPNVTVLLESQILEMNGKTNLESLTVLDKKNNRTYEFKTDGIFIEIGSIPNTKLLEGLIELSDTKEIIVDANQHTSLSGLFAAGDATINPHKQVIIAAAEGAKAALEAAIYINKKGE